MPNLMPPFRLNYNNLDKYQENREYEIYSPAKIPGKRYEDIQISTDGDIYRLKDKTQFDIVSVVVGKNVKYQGNDFYEIKWTKSSTLRRKYLSYLFELLLIEFEFQVISDKDHTSPGSKEFWLSLGQKKNYELFVFNTETNHKRKYKNISEDKVWGLKQDYLSQVNDALFDVRDTELIETYEQSEEEYEFEGFEEIDLIVLNSTVASEEIYKFVSQHNSKIEDRSNIRLIVQKTIWANKK